jgi:hypothetical protein
VPGRYTCAAFLAIYCALRRSRLGGGGLAEPAVLEEGGIETTP